MFRIRAWIALGLPVWFVFLAGCSGGGSHSYDYLIPSTSTARQALETALTHWQQGQPPGRIDSVSPSIEVVDSQWQAGQELEQFQILDEEEGEGPRRFAVRLTLKNPAEEQTVHFVVLGKEPLWVYRQQDFDKLSGM